MVVSNNEYRMSSSVPLWAIAEACHGSVLVHSQHLQYLLT